MYRQSSFSSKAESLRTASVDIHEASEDQVIFLKGTGRFINKGKPFQEGGLVAAFRNFPTRNKTWPISSVCCNQKTGGFAIADDKGQIYKMSVAHNTYNSVRLASTGVSAMGFINLHKNHLVVAYDSGSIIVLDTHTKDIIGNLQGKSNTVARIIQSHPTELKVAIASEDKTLAIWDLNTCQCVQSMQCEEPIVDVRYELGGQVIVVVLEHTGAYFYGTDASAELLMHLKLPSSEEAPKWTAYCAYNVYLDALSQFSRQQRQSADPVALHVILASHTSMLYSWHVCVADLLEPGRDRTHALRSGGEVVPPSHLVGVVELPLKNRVAVALQLINPNSTNSGTLGSSNLPSGSVSASFSGAADLPPRLLVVTQQGGALVVDVEGFQVKSVGFFTVKADLEPRLLHGEEASSDVGWLAQGVGSRRPVAPLPSASPGATTAAQGASNKGAYGKVHTTKNLIVIAGCDGTARVFDVRGMLGTGSLCGAVLRSRVPKVLKSSKTQLHSAQHIGVGSAATSSARAQSDSQADAARSVRAGGHSARLVQQYMSQPPERDHSTARSPSAGGELSSLASSQPTRYVNGMEAAAMAGYDFILLDSRDDELDEQAESQLGRKSSFRSASSARTGGPSSTVRPTTAARPVRAATASQATVRAATAGPGSGRQSSRLSRDKASSRVLQSFVATHKDRKKSDADLTNVPLFELAALSPKESQVNARKLKNFLDLNGEFPSRYRPLIWRFLLKLPENTVAFADLVNRGIHPSFENLYDKYPIQNRKIFDRLQNLCSQVAHWAPILADAPYLPALVFPFTLVYNTDELAALETVLSIMMWWGHSWHATHPNPPVHLVDALDNLLKYHDSKLHGHLKSLKVSPGVLGWAMVNSLFTEVLSRTNWLKLMDALFCHFDQIAIILLAPVAIMKELKSILMSCDTASQITLLLRSQQNVNMITVNRTIQEWLRHTPPKFFSAVATRHLDGVRLELGPGRVTEELQLSDVNQASENLALSTGRPAFPLPKGRYPAYDGFPKHILDLQIRERNKILALGQEVIRRESVLTALQQKLAEVESDHTMWMNKHKSASDAEVRHHLEMMARERAHLAELQRIEEEISRQRLGMLTTLESAAKDEMDLMDKAAREAHKLLEETELHMKEKMAIQLGLQKHREVAEVAEVATHERIRQLQMRRIREDWVKNVAETVRSREEELTLRDTILDEQWRKEDDRQRLLREQRLRELKALEEDTRMGALQEDLTLRMQRLEMERQAKILDLERARAARLAKEQADEALEAAERAALLLRKQETLSATEQTALIAERAARRAAEKMQETLHDIAHGRDRILEEERVHAQRLNRARMQARQAQLRREVAEKETQQTKEIVSTHGEMQSHLLSLQQAQLRTELERDMLLHTAGALQSDELEHVKHQHEAVRESIMTEQQQRFNETTDFMRSQLRAAAARTGRPAPAPPAPSPGPGSPAEDLPGWDRPPSSIPAPLSGAGIGYGVRPPAPPAPAPESREGGRSRTGSTARQAFVATKAEQAEDLSDIEREARAYGIPLDKAVKLAGSAMRTTGSLFEDDEDSLNPDDRLPPRSMARQPDSAPHLDRPMARGVTARSLQQDALDLAALDSAYAFSGEGTSSREDRTHSATASHESGSWRVFTTTISNPRGPHALRTESLKQMASQSLKHLSATRVMNRDEVEQEKQEHQTFAQVSQHYPTAPSDAAIAEAAHDAEDSPAEGLAQGGAAATAGIGAAGTGVASTASTSTDRTPGSPTRRGTVVESNTALWAMDEGSDYD